MARFTALVSLFFCLFLVALVHDYDVDVKTSRKFLLVASKKPIKAVKHSHSADDDLLVASKKPIKKSVKHCHCADDDKDEGKDD